MKKIKLSELVPSSLQNKYGKVFMGHSEEMAKAQKGSTEPNTREELHIQYILQQWVQSSGASLDKWIHELYEYYPDIKEIAKANPELRVPTGTTIYRGATVKDEELWNRIFSGKTSSITTLTYKPWRSKVQSWTPNKEVSEGFKETSFHTLRREVSNTMYIQYAHNPEFKKLFVGVDEAYIEYVKYSVLHLYQTIILTTDFSKFNLQSEIQKLKNQEHSGITSPLNNVDFIAILKHLVAMKSRYTLPYSFPAVVSYTVQSSDFVLFPNQLFYHIMNGQSVNADDDEYSYHYDEHDKFEAALDHENEVLFFDVPEIKFPVKQND